MQKEGIIFKVVTLIFYFAKPLIAKHLPWNFIKLPNAIYDMHRSPHYI